MADGNEQAPTSPNPDWEDDLTPERVQLKETAQLLASVLQAVRFDNPATTIAGFAESFLRNHVGQLPQAVVNEINAGREEILKTKNQT